MPESTKTGIDQGKDAGVTSTAPVPRIAEVFVEREDEGGSIRISETVIASVVRKYTLEVPGVAAFASDTIVDGIADILRRQRHINAITVRDMQEECVSITVGLVLEFGVIVPDVGQDVQQTIRERVEELTGKCVGKVNVLVQALRELPAETKPVAPHA